MWLSVQAMDFAVGCHQTAWYVTQIIPAYMESQPLLIAESNRMFIVL